MCLLNWLLYFEISVIKLNKQKKLQNDLILFHKLINNNYNTFSVLVFGQVHPEFSASVPSQDLYFSAQCYAFKII